MPRIVQLHFLGGGVIATVVKGGDQYFAFLVLKKIGHLYYKNVGTYIIQSIEF